ncbi:MAG: HsdR family type I site-specific deoxyribonuclease [Ignavibacteriaceae bacterium]|nr:HsdR family type I site-specific deoxyribonuclease [Ignavibacteriaceae bacterium]
MNPTELTSVQFPILQYVEQIGWSVIPRTDAERRRNFEFSAYTERDKAVNASRFFTDTLFQKVHELNPKFDGKDNDILHLLESLLPNIRGNRDFLNLLRGKLTWFCKSENRELNLILIDYDNPKNNTYEVTPEYYFYNGRYANREDVVFLINGIPVLVIECKNATKDEAIALGIDQIRRYHNETPEMMVPPQIFTSTESIGFSYGVTWNTVRRNIFNWKNDEIGNLEAKIKSFCSVEHILSLLREYILFTEQNDELEKIILRQHQITAVEKVFERSLDPGKNRGLVWHTQGSGKTFTMIKTAELLLKSPSADKPTVLILIDRNELEDQMKKNLVALGIANVEHAGSIKTLQRLLKRDYRGIILSMVHKFRDMPADVNLRHNIYVLIDEAHRTTGGDLGNFLMAAIPNASFIGFTGTPIDKTVYGRGTFKTFGINDAEGYLHKYSISDSIADGTTVPLYYSIAPNEMLVPKEILDKEFMELAEAEGVSDIEELNKILDRAVNTKNFLKASSRVDKVAAFVAKHYRDNVEPLGYKAFMVAVDRPACALYKKALDKYLPPEYSQVVYTGSNNDTEDLKAYHISHQQEKQIRRTFKRVDTLPKILIVTEKLLTGFDAPILYAMYLDKPMKDHTLLQAIARVNRPYENEEKGMLKPHGFVLDFVGIFENLEKALAFDSDEIDSIIKDIQLLKNLFQSKMEKDVPPYLKLISHGFNNKDTDNLIDYFRDKSLRKELFRLFKEVEMLYEIISPDKFLRPYMDDYTKFVSIYKIVRNAYSRRIMVDRELLRKTNDLVQKNVGGTTPFESGKLMLINEETLAYIKSIHQDDNIRVINLVKSIEKFAGDNTSDPYLIGMKERAEAVQENYENKQHSTQEALALLTSDIETYLNREKEKKAKGFSSIIYFIYTSLQAKSFNNAEQLALQIQKEFQLYPNFLTVEKDYRDLSQALYIILLQEEDDIKKIASFVEYIFSQLFNAQSRQI